MSFPENLSIISLLLLFKTYYGQQTHGQHTDTMILYAFPYKQRDWKDAKNNT
jgi:hypothetical protein